jgi:D-tyrosyl-tRNA(Tyr) deacylase
MAQTQKGLRPDFDLPCRRAKQKSTSNWLLRQSQFANVQTGIFAADMKVHLVNDGPVTFNLEVE